MLGAGLGRTTLYMRGVRDGVVDVFAGSGVPGPLEVSDTAAGVWPAVVAGVAAISGIWAGLGWSIALVHKTTSLLACSAHPPPECAIMGVTPQSWGNRRVSVLRLLAKSRHTTAR